MIALLIYLGKERRVHIPYAIAAGMILDIGIAYTIATLIRSL